MDVGVGEVGDEVLTAHRRSGLLGSRLVPVEQQDGRALVGEPGGDRAADTARGAGDQGSPSGQRGVHGTSTLRAPHHGGDVYEPTLCDRYMCSSSHCLAQPHHLQRQLDVELPARLAPRLAQELADPAPAAG